ALPALFESLEDLALLDLLGRSGVVSLLGLPLARKLLLDVLELCHVEQQPQGPQPERQEAAVESHADDDDREEPPVLLREPSDEARRTHGSAVRRSAGPGPVRVHRTSAGWVSAAAPPPCPSGGRCVCSQSFAVSKNW